MQALSVLLLSLVATAYGLPEPRIIGGKEAPVGKFPYQVSLRQSGRHSCGASIINSRYVLTAAHCVTGLKSPKSITVHVGTNLLSSEGTPYEVDKIAYHRYFTHLLLINDVALIRVVKDIAFNDLVQPIPLASGNKTYEGSPSVLSGWGMVHLDENLPDRLQYINLQIENQQKCREKIYDLHIAVVKSHICTFTKYGEGVCRGDSGGPLVIDGVQIGVVSFGNPCAVGYPDVFTRVSSFRSWIDEQQAILQKDNIGSQSKNAIYIS
nr:PREDICTED: chymotrypsin-1-like [Megachile rotundata]